MNDPTAHASTMTRAQVQADLMQARRDGAIKVWSSSYSQADNSRSVATREQVRAEQRADATGRAGISSSAPDREDSGSFAINRALTRELPLTLARAR